MTDVVYCKNGSVVKGIITEQVPDKYITIQTDNGSTFVFQMSEIERIAKEQTQTATATTTPLEMCAKAKADARYNYNGSGSCAGGTWAVTLLTSPLFGLIPAAIGSTGTPDDYRLNYPDFNDWQNTTYKDCYRDEAKRIKRNKAWKAWGISSGVWVACAILLLSQQ